MWNQRLHAGLWVQGQHEQLRETLPQKRDKQGWAYTLSNVLQALDSDLSTWGSGGAISAVLGRSLCGHWLQSALQFGLLCLGCDFPILGSAHSYLESELCCPGGLGWAWTSLCELDWTGHILSFHRSNLLWILSSFFIFNKSPCVSHLLFHQFCQRFVFLLVFLRDQLLTL